MLSVLVKCLIQVEIKDCASVPGVNSTSIICAGGDGRGVCQVILFLKFFSAKLLIQGDSGGPLTTVRKIGENRIHTLVGVVSFGIQDCGEVISSYNSF